MKNLIFKNKYKFSRINPMEEVRKTFKLKGTYEDTDKSLLNDDIWIKIDDRFIHVYIYNDDMELKMGLQDFFYYDLPQPFIYRIIDFIENKHTSLLYTTGAITWIVLILAELSGGNIYISIPLLTWILNLF